MRSMTGFGRGQSESSLGQIIVELKSVNSRFLDMNLRLPQELSSLEPAARNQMQKRFNRGKVYLQARYEPSPTAESAYHVNEALLDMLMTTCSTRSHEPPQIEVLLTVPGVVISHSDEKRIEALRELFMSALKSAMGQLEEEREREGESLRAALKEIHGVLVSYMDEVESARPLVVAKYRERLHARLEELLGEKGAALDPGRLEQEVAMFAEKADITEEVKRLHSHFKALEGILEQPQTGSIGKNLDFLQQEIVREVNTIGSKCRDLDIARSVLDMKKQAERMREQAANIE